MKRRITKDDFIKVIDTYLSEIEGINDLKAYLETTNFYEDPASYRYHSAYPTGLINHSYLVTQNLLNLSKKFNIKWDRKESPILIGLFHDLCKADTYVIEMRNTKNAAGQWVKEPFYKPIDNEPLGHGSKSVILLQRYIKLTKQEQYCIYHHMGAFTEKELQYAYSAMCSVAPEVMIVALADQIAGVMETREEMGIDDFPLEV
jgi:hypothetical protein